LACVAVVACGTIDASGFQSECYSVTAGAVSLSCGRNITFEGSGLCVMKRHSACADITRIVVRAGADHGGDGSIDTPILNLDESAPALPWYGGRVSGSIGTPPGGWPSGSVATFQWEVYKAGQDTPVASGSDEKGL
jgi:hypothetical protein